MKQKIYQVDAFADRLFTGNPAAVCVLPHWIENELMQNIAMENNLAETAFIVKEKDYYHIRWFTPELEVALCGHATLASAFVLFTYYAFPGNRIPFYSKRSGALSVTRETNGYLTLDFPSDTLEEVPMLPELNEALGKAPLQIFKGKTDYLLIYSSQTDIEQMNPNFFLLNAIDARGIIVSAPGNEVDVVSRFFAPCCGISEDPVTGSAHTSLIPYWAERLGKSKLVAKQLSARGGTILCEFKGARVNISGKAIPYLIGEIIV